MLSASEPDTALRVEHASDFALENQGLRLGLLDDGDDISVVEVYHIVGLDVPLDDVVVAVQHALVREGGSIVAVEGQNVSTFDLHLPALVVDVGQSDFFSLNLEHKADGLVGPKSFCLLELVD